MYNQPPGCQGLPPGAVHGGGYGRRPADREKARGPDGQGATAWPAPEPPVPDHGHWCGLFSPVALDCVMAWQRLLSEYTVALILRRCQRRKIRLRCFLSVRQNGDNPLIINSLHQ